MSALPANVTFADLLLVPWVDWLGYPTLESGHWENLKFESSTYRVWVTRQTVKDYGGDELAWRRERVRIEKLVDGAWLKLDRFGRIEA